MTSYIGLMQLGEMLLEKATALEALQTEQRNHEHENEIIRIYECTIAIHDFYAQELAMYYESNSFPKTMVEKLYLNAIRHDSHPRALFNLADFYKKQKCYAQMVLCCLKAIDVIVQSPPTQQQRGAFTWGDMGKLAVLDVGASVVSHEVIDAME